VEQMDGESNPGAGSATSVKHKVDARSESVCPNLYDPWFHKTNRQLGE